MSVDITDIFVLSFTEVYPPEMSTGSRTIRPEPASTVRSLKRALIQISFSFDAYLFKQTGYRVITDQFYIICSIYRSEHTIIINI